MLSPVLVSLPVHTIPNKPDGEIKGTFPGWLSAAFAIHLCTRHHKTAFANLGVRINRSAFEVCLEVQCIVPCYCWRCKYLTSSLSNKNWYAGEIDTVNMTDKRGKKTGLFFCILFSFVKGFWSCMRSFCAGEAACSRHSWLGFLSRNESKAHWFAFRGYIVVLYILRLHDLCSLAVLMGSSLKHCVEVVQNNSSMGDKLSQMTCLM